MCVRQGTPSDPVAQRTTFSWRYQYFTSLWRNFGTCFFMMLLQFIDICGDLRVSFLLWFGVWLGPLLFAAAVGITDLFQDSIWPSLSCQTDGIISDSYTKDLTVNSMTSICTGPVASEQAKIIALLSPFLTVSVCADILCMIFSKQNYGQTSRLWSHLFKEQQIIFWNL